MYELNICHLYPDLLNLYGDSGNLRILEKRCEWRNIGVKVTPVTIGDRFCGEDYDLVFIGGGQDYEQEILTPDLLSQKANELKNYIVENKVLLAICGGYQLLGKYYKAQNGKEMEFLGALNLWSAAGKKRKIGDLVFECDFLGSERKNNLVVGFENHSGATYLGPEVKPMGKVIKGYGNNGKDGSEGAVYKNTFCTYGHGCLLAKNPAFSDYLIRLALEKKYNAPVSLQALDDSLEISAHDRVLKALGL